MLKVKQTTTNGIDSTYPADRDPGRGELLRGSREGFAHDAGTGALNEAAQNRGDQDEDARRRNPVDIGCEDAPVIEREADGRRDGGEFSRDFREKRARGENEDEHHEVDASRTEEPELMGRLLFLPEAAVFAGRLVLEDPQPQKQIGEARQAPREGDKLRPEEERRQVLRDGGRDADPDQKREDSLYRAEAAPDDRDHGDGKEEIEDRELKNHRRGEVRDGKVRQVGEHDHRDPGRAEGGGDRIGDERCHGRPHGFEPEREENPHGDRDRNAEARSSFEEPPEAPGDEKNLDSAVVRNRREALLNHADGAGAQHHVVGEDRREDDEDDGPEAFDDAVGNAAFKRSDGRAEVPARDPENDHERDQDREVDGYLIFEDQQGHHRKRKETRKYREYGLHDCSKNALNVGACKKPAR